MLFANSFVFSLAISFSSSSCYPSQQQLAQFRCAHKLFVCLILLYRYSTRTHRAHFGWQMKQAANCTFPIWPLHYSRVCSIMCIIYIYIVRVLLATSHNQWKSFRITAIILIKTIKNLRDCVHLYVADIMRLDLKLRPLMLMRMGYERKTMMGIAASSHTAPSAEAERSSCLRMAFSIIHFDA